MGYDAIEDANTKQTMKANAEKMGNGISKAVIDWVQKQEFNITKQIKNFIYTSFFAVFNILIFTIISRYLLSFDTTSITLYSGDGNYLVNESKNFFSYFFSGIKDQLLHIDLHIILRIPCDEFLMHYLQVETHGSVDTFSSHMKQFW